MTCPQFFTDGTGAGEITEYSIDSTVGHTEYTTDPDEGAVEDGMLTVEGMTEIETAASGTNFEVTATQRGNPDENNSTATVLPPLELQVTVVESDPATDAGEDFDDLEIGDGQTVNIPLTRTDGSHIYFTPGTGLGDILEYTAESDSTDVSVRVRGGDTLRITGREVGDADITVTAEDGTGTNPTKVIFVEVGEEHVTQDPETVDPVDPEDAAPDPAFEIEGEADSLSALGGDGLVTLTWDADHRVEFTDWEVRWKYGTEAYSRDDWHSPSALDPTGTAL